MKLGMDVDLNSGLIVFYFDLDPRPFDLDPRLFNLGGPYYCCYLPAKRVEESGNG